MPLYWTIEQLQEELPKAKHFTGLLRRLGLCSAGGNHKTVRRWIKELGLDSSHLVEGARVARKPIVDPTPLDQVMVEGSTYSRSHLKKRLIRSGLLKEVCSLCGQPPVWRGKRMSLILDHINGRNNDHRMENLRLVCPNCNATLETFCGRNPPQQPKVDGRLHGRPNLKQRRVQRPPYQALLSEIEEAGYEAVGRKYGVSGSAIRKWIACYKKHGE